MKRLTLALLIAALPLGAFAAEPDRSARTAAATAPKQESRFKGAMFDALRNLSGMLPKPSSQKDNANQAATIGIRGAESTTTVMTPYWKDDKTSDPAFQAQMQAFSAAQQLLEDGKLQEAEAAFAGFIKDHPASDLQPNARFGRALALAAQGDKKQGRDALESFVNDYPQHPLVADANKVLAELK